MITANNLYQQNEGNIEDMLEKWKKFLSKKRVSIGRRAKCNRWINLLLAWRLFHASLEASNFMLTNEDCEQFKYNCKPKNDEERETMLETMNLLQEFLSVDQL